MEAVISKTPNKLFEQAKKFLSSKLIVLIALVGLSIGAFTTISQPKADDVSFSQIYQYYLLADKHGTENFAKASTSESGSEAKSGKLAGILGNGGNQGTFNYSDIINGAPPKSRNEAKKFSHIMGTLAGYNYISVQSNGVNKIIFLLGRFVVGLFLLVVGVMTDLLSLFWNLIVNVIAEYNIFNLLGSAFGASKAGDQMAKALGMNADDIKDWISFGITVFTAVILYTLVRMLRHGGTNIDEADRRKFIGRIVGLLGIPVVVTMVCMILSDVTQLAPNTNPSKNPVYASWMMDVQDWAEKHNFNISIGNIGDIDSSGKSYVDASYNPYGPNKKANKIGQALYASSGIAQNDSKWPNTAMAISYMLSETFDARDYLGYIDDHDIGDYVKQNQFSGEAKGSKLYDFDNAYTDFGNAKANWSAPAGISKAKNDYGKPDDKDKAASANKTWEDRFIFGAKNTGDLASYYKQQPSAEQVYSTAGSGSNNNNLTYESMFLVLSTDFSDRGGEFSLDGPTYGAYATISKFDSNRYAYYRYSMVGNPIFTIPAMATNGMLSALVGLAAISALWSVGIVNMNLKPLRAWMKSISFGDIEYSEATLIYGLGIGATALTITLVPNALVDLFTGISDMIGSLLSGNNNAGTQTVLSSEMLGTSYWASFAFALAGLVMFRNSKSFRDKLIELLTIPWEWASAKGQALEDSVNDGMVAQGRQETRNALKDRRHKKNSLLEDISMNRTSFGKGLNQLTNGAAGDLSDKLLTNRAKTGDYNIGTRPDGLHSNRELTMDEIKRRGDLRRMGNAIGDLTADTEAPDALANQFDDHATPDDGLAEDQLVNPDGTMNADNPYISPETAAAMSGVNAMADDLANRDQKLQDLTNAGAQGLTPEEAKQLNQDHELEDKVLGKDGAKDYQDLQHKLARGEQLTPEEQKRLDKYNKELSDAGVTPDKLQDMADLEQKASPLLSPEQTTELNELQTKAGQILGDKDLHRYQDLESKKLSGEPLDNKEQQELSSYTKKLKNNGMKPSELRRYENLQSRGQTGVSPHENGVYSSLMKKGTDAPNMDNRKMKDFARLSKKAANNTITPAEKTKLSEYKSALKGTLTPQEIGHLQSIASRRTDGKLNTDEIGHLKQLEAKNALEQKGRMALSGGQQEKLSSLQFARDNAFRSQDPEGAAKLKAYTNMRGQMNNAQLAEFKKLQERARNIADKSMSAGQLKEFNHLNQLRHPRLPNGESSQMTIGERNQLNALKEKAARGLGNRKRSLDRLDRQIKDNVATIQHNRSQLVNKAQNIQEIQHAKLARVNEANANAIGVGNIQRAFRTFASGGGTVDDANRLVKATQDALDRTTNPSRKAAIAKVAENIADQTKNFNFIPRGSVDLNGDGKVDLNDGTLQSSPKNPSREFNDLTTNIQRLRDTITQVEKYGK